MLRYAGHKYDRMHGSADAQYFSFISYSGRRTGIPSSRYYIRPERQRFTPNIASHIRSYLYDRPYHGVCGYSNIGPLIQRDGAARAR
jgi:hypothetical protein